MTADAPIDTLARLLGAGPPIATDAWSLDDAPLRSALQAVDSGARRIVECGSGRSTIVLARRLAELEDGSVHSLEHDAAWALRTRAQLAAEKLDRAEVIDAPLERHPLAGETGGWYSLAELVRLPAEIDLLLIDGPPAGDPALRRSRQPAVPALSDRLKPGATILLDDAGRPGEAEALAIWSREHELEFQLDPDHGFATARWPLYVARHS